MSARACYYFRRPCYSCVSSESNPFGMLQNESKRWERAKKRNTLALVSSALGRGGLGPRLSPNIPGCGGRRVAVFSLWGQMKRSKKWFGEKTKIDGL